MPQRYLGMFFLVVGAASLMFGCGSPTAEQSPVEAAVVIDGSDNGSSSGGETTLLASEPSEGSPSKRVAVLREHVERELTKAFEAQNSAVVDFDTLALVQNKAFDSITVTNSNGVGCSYSMSTLPDHIFVYLSCDDDSQEFDWRP